MSEELARPQYARCFAFALTAESGVDYAISDCDKPLARQWLASEQAKFCLQIARRRLKPGGVRTRLVISASLALGVFLVWLAVSSCATHPSGSPADTKHNAVFESGGAAILLPGTEVSDADAEAVNRILSKYDKEIYVLKTYRNAKLTKTRGSLKNLVLDSKLMSAMAVNVKKAGFTQFAVQLGVGNNPQKPGPSPAAGNNPQVMPSASPVGSGVTQAQKAQQASMDLVTELKPILDKYR